MNQAAKFFNLTFLTAFTIIMAAFSANCVTEKDIVDFYTHKENMLEAMINYLSFSDQQRLFCNQFLGDETDHIAEIEFIYFKNNPDLKFPAVSCIALEPFNFEAYIILAKIDDAYKYVRLEVIHPQHRRRKFVNRIMSIMNTYDYQGPDDLRNLTISYFNNFFFRYTSKGVLERDLTLIDTVCKAFRGGGVEGPETLEKRDITIGDYQVSQVWTIRCATGFRVASVDERNSIFMLVTPGNNYETIFQNTPNHDEHVD